MSTPVTTDQLVELYHEHNEPGTELLLASLHREVLERRGVAYSTLIKAAEQLVDLGGGKLRYTAGGHHLLTLSY